MEQGTWIKKEEIPLEKLEKVGIKRDFVGQMENNRTKICNDIREILQKTVSERAGAK